MSSDGNTGNRVSRVLASVPVVSFNRASAAMASDSELFDRAAQIARVLRPLGRKPMSMEQAQVAGKLLGLHWTTMYRLP
jgi:hypothetical protein